MSGRCRSGSRWHHLKYLSESSRRRWVLESLLGALEVHPVLRILAVNFINSVPENGRSSLFLRSSSTPLSVTFKDSSRRKKWKTWGENLWGENRDGEILMLGGVTRKWWTRDKITGNLRSLWHPTVSSFKKQRIRSAKPIPAGTCGRFFNSWAKNGNSSQPNRGSPTSKRATATASALKRSLAASSDRKWLPASTGSMQGTRPCSPESTPQTISQATSYSTGLASRKSATPTKI